MTTRAVRQREYDLFKVVSATASDRPLKGFEGEVSAEMRRQLEGEVPGLSSGGVVIPGAEIMATRLDTTTPGKGSEGAFPRVHHSEALLPQSRLRQLGTSLVTDAAFTGHFWREIGLPSTSYVPEDPEADVEEGGATFSSLEAPLKTIMTTVSNTRQIERLATPQLRRIVERGVRRAGLNAVEIAALTGTGADNQPRGLLNTEGVGLVEAGTPDGGSLDWSHVTALRAEVADKDGDNGPTGFLGTPRLREALENTPELGAGGAPIWRGNQMAGELALASNQLPSDLTKGEGEDLHALIYGNWSALIVQIVAFELLRDPYAQKKSGVVELTLFAHLAVAVTHPESFAVVRDAAVS